MLAALLAAGASGQDWQPLFNGKSLEGWRETPYTDRGQVRVSDSEIVLARGAPLTGVTRTQSFPGSSYEIRFEAARVSGNDFFAALTFPVDDSFCTFVAGGWGGDILGLSSIDGWDASDNETRSYLNFENGHWYAFRLRVRDDRIQVWIDERMVVDVDVSGRSLSLYYGETRLSAPLGFASYNTTGKLRKIEYRVLRERESNGR